MGVLTDNPSVQASGVQPENRNDDDRRGFVLVQL
jgi:hypothetical protein